VTAAKRRLSDLAKIHIAKKDLGMDDDDYRAMLQNIAGVGSSADLSIHGRSKVLHHLESNLGWKPKPQARKARQKITATTPVDRKIRALWLDLANAGAVRDRSEKALASYVKRQTGIDRLDWLSSKQAERVIEALKQWVARIEQQEGGTDEQI